MSMYDDVEQFIEKMEMGYSVEVMTLYLHLIEEEYEEWLQEAFSKTKYNAERELKELCDVLYVLVGYLLQNNYGHNRKFDLPKKPGSMTKAIEDVVEEGYKTIESRCDTTVIVKAIAACVDYAKEREWDILEAFARVHKSNMSKLDDNGKPVRNEAGKVVKGPNYKKPNLSDLV